MDKETEKKIIGYVEALESINQHLIITLRKCLNMLEHIKPFAPDQGQWQCLLDDMRKSIRSGEKLQSQKPLN